MSKCTVGNVHYAVHPKPVLTLAHHPLTGAQPECSGGQVPSSEEVEVVEKDDKMYLHSGEAVTSLEVGIRNPFRPEEEVQQNRPMSTCTQRRAEGGRGLPCTAESRSQDQK